MSGIKRCDVKDTKKKKKKRRDSLNYSGLTPPSQHLPAFAVYISIYSPSYALAEAQEWPTVHPIDGLQLK